MTFCSESVWVQDPAVIQEEQGIVGDAVQAASEETDFPLQVVSLPNRKLVKLLDGHPKNTEELLLREVPLQGERHAHRRGERERESSVQ